MGVVRAFVAIELPEDIQNGLRKASAGLQAKLAGLPLRWMPVESIHLTLKFLGDAPTDAVDAISQALQKQARAAKAFEVGVGGLGVFPNLRRPRVVWVGMEAAEELVAFQQSLEDEMERQGFPAEGRPFSPHLTLARVQRKASGRDTAAIGERLAGEKTGELGRMWVEGVTLFRSQLKPTGAEYEALFHAEFGAKE